MLREYRGNIWERQAWESDAQFAAFLAYRDLGLGRTIDAAFGAYSRKNADTKERKKGTKEAQKGAKKDQVLKRANGRFRAWSKNNEWSKRALEYDNYELRQIDAAKIEAKKKAEAEKIERAKDLALAALERTLEKTTKERVRKKYEMVKGEQVLKDVITDQETVLPSFEAVKWTLQTRMPEAFGTAQGSEQTKEMNEQIVIIRNVIEPNTHIHESTGRNFLSDDRAA